MKKTKKSVCAILCMTGMACGALGIAACNSAHEHSWSDDWKTDAEQHWHECTDGDCDEKDAVGAHSYGEWQGDERECTVCGYTQTRNHEHDFTGAWKSDANGHWHECGCNEKDEKKQHDFKVKSQTPATCISTGEAEYECKTCGYEYTETLQKVNHSFAEEYSFDDNNHYYVCTVDGCGAHNGTQAHDLNETVLKPADLENTGLKKVECKVCDYEKEVVIPRIESQNFSVTVYDKSGEPLQGVTVKLGEYTADTGADGVASVKAEKQEYTVVLEGLPYEAEDKILYDKNVTVSATQPAAAVWLAQAAPSEGGSTEANPKVITEDGVYYVNLAAVPDPEISGRYTIRDYYIAARAVAGAATLKVEILNDKTTANVMDAGYDMIENKGASYSIVKEKGEQTVFAVTSSDTEITAQYRFTAFFKVSKSVAPEAGCKERPIRAAEGENVKSVSGNAEKVYFKLDYNTFGKYAAVTFGDGVTVYDLGLRVEGNGDIIANDTTLTVPQYGYRYLYAFGTAGECKINLAKTVLEGMKGRPFTVKTDGSDNSVTFDMSEGIYEQWFKVEVPEDGNYILKTNDATSVLTSYSDIEGENSIVKSGLGTSLPVALTANTPVYIKATSSMNRNFKFTCNLATADDLGTNPQQPMQLVSGDYNVNFSTDTEGMNTYYVYTAEQNEKLTISYSKGGESFSIAIYNNPEFDGANDGQLAYIYKWEQPHVRYLYAGETYYFKTNAYHNASLVRTFKFEPVALAAHDYEITFALPDGTPVSEALEIKLMKGEEQVASGTLSEGKVTFANVIPDNFTIVVEGTLPEGYGCYDRNLTIGINDNEKTEKTVTLTQYVNFSFTVALPGAEAAPVEGARIVLENTYTGKFTTSATDGEGKVTFATLPPVNANGADASFSVSVILPEGVAADYFVSGAFSVTKAQNELTITLNKKMEVTVKVVLPDGTTAVADKKVSIGFSSSEQYEGVTDADGIVKIKIPAVSTNVSVFSVTVELDESMSELYYTTTASLSGYTEGAEKLITLKAYKNYSLTLKENDVAVGAGIEVTLTKSNETWTQTTDENGTVNFSKLVAGNYTITLSDDYLTTAKITSSSEGTLDIECYHVENMDKLVNGLSLSNARTSETPLTAGKTPVKNGTDKKGTQFFKFKAEQAGTYVIEIQDITLTGNVIDRVFARDTTTNLFSATDPKITVVKDEADKAGSGYTKIMVTFTEADDYVVFKLIKDNAYSYVNVTFIPAD